MNMVEEKVNRSKPKPLDIIVTAFMIILCVLSLIPIYVLVVNATRTSVDITAVFLPTGRRTAVFSQGAPNTSKVASFFSFPAM